MWSIASKYQTLITQQISSYIIVFTSLFTLWILYIRRTFSFSSVGVPHDWAGEREPIRKWGLLHTNTISYYSPWLGEHFIHYSWINYFSNFKKQFWRKNVIRFHLWGQWTTFCGSLGHPAKKLTDLKYSPRNIFYVLKQRCQCTWNSALRYLLSNK